MPPRLNLTGPAPMSNPPEMLLPPNSMPIPAPPPPIPTPPQNYPIQERPPIQNYPPLEQHGYQDLKFQDKKMPSDSQYTHYGLPDNVMQYSPHIAPNYNSQPPIYPQNYPNSQAAPPPPAPSGPAPLPAPYAVNYPSHPNFQGNQNYSNQSNRDFVQQGPSFAPHHSYRYPNPGYIKTDGPPYPDYTNISQPGDGYSRGNLPLTPPSMQESYVLTQLTESSKSNYPVQSFPISESSFSQPEYHQMFSEESKGFESKVMGASPGMQPLQRVDRDDAGKRDESLKNAEEESASRTANGKEMDEREINECTEKNSVVS